MHWCKAMDRKAYTALTKVYTNSLSKLYDRDIKQFFEEAKQQISGMREKKGECISSVLYPRIPPYMWSCCECTEKTFADS